MICTDDAQRITRRLTDYDTRNLKFVKEQTEALIAAHSCSAEAKAAAEKWLAAVGTAEEAEVTKAYIAELEADIMPIDGLIVFAGSEAGVGVFRR